MLYFQVPGYSTAKWLIQSLKLKKIMTEAVFELFRQENKLVIISGQGPVNAASACSYLLGKYPAAKQDIFVLLEAVLQPEASTHVALIHQIADTLLPPYKEYYPDMLYKHPFQETGLVCKHGPSQDMETAYAFAVASRFIVQHQIVAAKFYINPEESLKTQQQIIAQFIGWLDQLGSHNCHNLQAENYPLGLIQENLHLTQAMVQILSTLLDNRKRKGLNSGPILRRYSLYHATGPKEAKQLYESLKKELEP